MKSKLERDIEKQVLDKFNFQIKSVHFIGGFDFGKLDYEQIKEMVLATNLELDSLSKLPFENGMFYDEINIYQVDDGVFITVRDSNELWQDLSVIELFKI